MVRARMYAREEGFYSCLQIMQYPCEKMFRGFGKKRIKMMVKKLNSVNKQKDRKREIKREGSKS